MSTAERFYVAVNNRNVSGLHVKCPTVTIFPFSRRIGTNAPVSKFTQIRPVGAELMHEDHRTDKWMNG
jgi:hypothetical protein